MNNEFSIRNEYSIEEKLEILSDAAKYDVACTSSGVDRNGKQGFIGNSRACGICHSFSEDGRCISLLKILLTNHCIFDCKYCINRRSNDNVRVAFTPDELCSLTIEFYKRNYIEGLFLSSGVMVSPEYTMERMIEVLTLLRTKYGFNGYIHVKAIPGAPEDLLAKLGLLADRMSINLEFPTGEYMKKLAPGKNFDSIMKPMSLISDTIAMHRLAIGKDSRMERSGINRRLENSIFTNHRLTDSSDRNILVPIGKMDNGLKRPFAPAGQSSQMIVGASDETDLELISTTQYLYQNYDLKRVFYSAYVPLNEDASLPKLGTTPPLLREHRLYQADWLLRFYGFHVGELLNTNRPNFNELIDPKCDWAVRHLDNFPVEVNTASCDQLLRVPGIGPKGVQRILEARKFGTLSFDILKKMGIVMKRAQYFITCGGKMLYNIPIEEQFITKRLVDANRKDNYELENKIVYRQMNLFDDFGLARE